MKSLVVEDDFTSRVVLQRFLAAYGPCEVAPDGRKGVERFCKALKSDQPYELVCLDIMMPEMDGHEALQQIRAAENEQEIAEGDSVKVIITSAAADLENVRAAARERCNAFIVKPYEKEKLIETLRSLDLIVGVKSDDDTEDGESATDANASANPPSD